MARYEGRSGDDLAADLALSLVAAFDEIGSTLDVAHELAAAGAAPGTLVLADSQTAGRGRLGRAWRSQPGAGVWLTLIERPSDRAALEVLSLRIGLALAPALDPFAESAVRLKWPNDLYVADRKLGGILVEARWREQISEWVAIGVGINVRAPDGELAAAGLRPGVSRLDVLMRVVPAIRTAAAQTGALTTGEVGAFATRDRAAGRRCVEPVRGRVRGVDRSGALVVDVGCRATLVHAGSLVLEEDQ
jgi:BirA family biotin operon repressor/biotin-[acetyl-CoA-carboxylase] ligase